MKDRKDKKSKIKRLGQKGKLHCVKLYMEMQRVYLIDIARHTYSDEYLDELDRKLKELQDLISSI